MNQSSTIETSLTPEEIGRRLDALFDPNLSANETIWKRIAPPGAAYAGSHDERGFIIKRAKEVYGPKLEFAGVYAIVSGKATSIELRLVRGGGLRAGTWFFGSFATILGALAIVLYATGDPSTALTMLALNVVLILLPWFEIRRRTIGFLDRERGFIADLISMTEEEAGLRADTLLVKDLSQHSAKRATTPVGSYTIATSLPPAEVARRLGILVGGNTVYSDYQSVAKPKYQGLVQDGAFRIHRTMSLPRTAVLDGRIVPTAEGSELHVSAFVQRFTLWGFVRSLGTALLIGMVTVGIDHVIPILVCMAIFTGIDTLTVVRQMREVVNRERKFLEKVLDVAAPPARPSQPRSRMASARR